MDNGSEDEDEEEEEEEEKPLKKRKGKGKSKSLKTSFMVHGPAKGEAKAVGTIETRAEVNTG